MRYAILALLALGTAYLLNAWVGDHALAVVTPGGDWEIAATGWGGVWPVLLAGLITGVSVGLIAGSKIGDLVTAWLASSADAAKQQLVAERQQIEAAKAMIDGEIQKAALEGRKEGAERASEAIEAMFAAQDKATWLERRLKATEGRLKGANQKAARMQKKAQLMSRDTAKPEETTGLVR